MDIEGAEHEAFENIFNTNKMVVGMAIEFHQIDNNCLIFNSIIKKALKNYHIVHIHGNNYCELIDYNNFPSTVEISFLHKDFVETPIELSKFSYPISGLDQPNRFSKPDIKFNFTNDN